MLGLPLHVQPGLADRKPIDRLEAPYRALSRETREYAQSSVHRLLKGAWGVQRPRSLLPRCRC